MSTEDKKCHGCCRCTCGKQPADPDDVEITPMQPTESTETAEADTERE